jgi:hypothetical protein
MSIEERVAEKLKNPKKAAKEEQSKLLGFNLNINHNDESSSKEVSEKSQEATKYVHVKK